MSSDYVPNFEFLDDEEKELQHLDAATSFPKEVQEELLEPYLSSPRKNVTMRLAEGIPYQTLASMILQKYVRGSLLEKETVKEVVKDLRA